MGSDFSPKSLPYDIIILFLVTLSATIVCDYKYQRYEPRKKTGIAANRMALAAAIPLGFFVLFFAMSLLTITASDPINALYGVALASIFLLAGLRILNRHQHIVRSARIYLLLFGIATCCFVGIVLIIGLYSLRSF